MSFCFKMKCFPFSICDVKIDVTDARDKNVIVIGGGDTGVDCVATCVRQVGRGGANFTDLTKITGL